MKNKPFHDFFCIRSCFSFFCFLFLFLIFSGPVVSQPSDSLKAFYEKPLDTREFTSKNFSRPPENIRFDFFLGFNKSESFFRPQEIYPLNIIIANDLFTEEKALFKIKGAIDKRIFKTGETQNLRPFPEYRTHKIELKIDYEFENARTVSSLVFRTVILPEMVKLIQVPQKAWIGLKRININITNVDTNKKIYYNILTPQVSDKQTSDYVYILNDSNYTIDTRGFSVLRSTIKKIKSHIFPVNEVLLSSIHQIIIPKAESYISTIAPVLEEYVSKGGRLVLFNDDSKDITQEYQGLTFFNEIRDQSGCPVSDNFGSKTGFQYSWGSGYITLLKGNFNKSLLGLFGDKGSERNPVFTPNKYNGAIDLLHTRSKTWSWAYKKISVSIDKMVFFLSRFNGPINDFISRSKVFSLSAIYIFVAVFANYFIFSKTAYPEFGWIFLIVISIVFSYGFLTYETSEKDRRFINTSYTFDYVPASIKSDENSDENFDQNTRKDVVKKYTTGRAKTIFKLYSDKRLDATLSVPASVTAIEEANIDRSSASSMYKSSTLRSSADNKSINMVEDFTIRRKSSRTFFIEHEIANFSAKIADNIKVESPEFGVAPGDKYFYRVLIPKSFIKANKIKKLFWYSKGLIWDYEAYSDFLVNLDESFFPLNKNLNGVKKIDFSSKKKGSPAINSNIPIELVKAMLKNADVAGPFLITLKEHVNPAGIVGENNPLSNMFVISKAYLFTVVDFTDALGIWRPELVKLKRGSSGFDKKKSRFEKGMWVVKNNYVNHYVSDKEGQKGPFPVINFYPPSASNIGIPINNSISLMKINSIKAPKVFSQKLLYNKLTNSKSRTKIEFFKFFKPLSQSYHLKNSETRFNPISLSYRFEFTKNTYSDASTGLQNLLYDFSIVNKRGMQ